MTSTRHILALTIALVVAGGAALGSACIQGGNEGDRCNPSLSHDECDNGLSCVQPGACVESYCCPANLASSKSSFCRGDPEACPPEAGAGATEDAASADSPSEASDSGAD